MANIRDKAVQFNSAITITEILNQFVDMTTKLKKDTGVVIDIQEGYKSKYEVLDELKARVKDKDRDELFGRPTSGSAEYDSLKDKLEALGPRDFQPPLSAPAQSVGEPPLTVYRTPYFSDFDPRRTGRLIIPKPGELLKSNQVKSWLINNSLLYGFLLYSDYALYYVGYQVIKNRVQQGEPLINVVSSYLTKTIPASVLTITNSTVLSGLTPELPQMTNPSELEYLVGTPVSDNNGNKPKLVVVDNKIMTETLAQAYLSMKQAAAADNVTVGLSSGFRPAFGPNVTLPTTKGRQILVTTQESIRRDRSRWSGRQNWTGDDQSYIMNAPASLFSPQTAKPGSSNHGGGIAVDLTTGNRPSGNLNTVLYKWLINNAHRFGFVRTVASEEWHFEYRPNVAPNGPYAVIAGTNQNRFYSDLGLTGIRV